jgi:hypothetical protein
MTYPFTTGCPGCGTPKTDATKCAFCGDRFKTTKAATTNADDPVAKGV